jgi:hypothetical protein
LLEDRVKKITFGRFGDWENLVRGTIDNNSYAFGCVNFSDFDLRLTDYAVPITLWDSVVLRNRYGDRSEKYLIPDARVIELCADKKIFNETILASDFAWMIPPIYRTAARVFPYVLKKRDELSGKEIFVVRDVADEEPHAARLSSDAYFCQAYMPGRLEYTTHMLITDGTVIYHSSNEYEMAEEFSVKGSNLAPIREIIGVDVGTSIINALAGLLRAIGFNGTCCVDYKIIDGRIRLLEVNPRCGFSLFRDINRYLQAYVGALRPEYEGSRAMAAMAP